MVKNIRETFEAESKHGHFYTGGAIQWTEDGSTLLCQCGGLVNVFDISSGTVTSTLNKPGEEEVEDTIYTFSLSADSNKLITSHRSGLLKLWLWGEGKIIKSWKSVHKGLVVCLSFNKVGNRIISGGTDGAVRLWDIENNTCLYSLRGATGVISVGEFHPSLDVPLVFAAGGDNVIHGWNIKNGESSVKFSGHYSKVTAIAFHNDDKHVVSCGRDKVIILWHLVNGILKTIPAFESLEGMVLLPSPISVPGGKVLDGSLFVATAGEKGIVRVWDMLAGREVYSQDNSLITSTADGGLSIVHLLLCLEKKSFGVVTADQNIIFHQWETFCCEKQLIGFTDEILDVVYLGKGNTHLAVATNSADIKVYNLSDMSCCLLKGHTDLVLALATTPANPNLLLSCAKDNSVRVWLMDEDTKVVANLAFSARHLGSVGSVALSKHSTSFFLSVSQDTTIKLWNLPKHLEKMSSSDLVVSMTEIAHEKDINCVCVAPNDKIAATGSQDRTAKLWCTETLSLLGVLRGHRRGVWSASFSPQDRVLLTSSADCCLKLWSLDDLSCLKTLEGHESSVLRAEFINNGTQIISTGGDGLLKVWLIKTGECLGTFDEHEGKVWALAVRDDGQALVTGDSNSTLVKWQDMTIIRQQEKIKEENEILLQEQTLANLIQSEELLKALQYALSLKRPFQSLKIIQGVIKKGGSGLVDVIKQLDNIQKEQLLNNALEWNTNSRNSQPAQLVFSALLEDLGTGKLKPDNFRNVLEGALPYTEQHFRRISLLYQDLQFINYTLACMQLHPDVVIKDDDEIKLDVE